MANTQRPNSRQMARTLPVTGNARAEMSKLLGPLVGRSLSPGVRRNTASRAVFSAAREMTNTSVSWPAITSVRIPRRSACNAARSENSASSSLVTRIGTAVSDFTGNNSDTSPAGIPVRSPARLRSVARCRVNTPSLGSVQISHPDSPGTRSTLAVVLLTG